MTRTLHALIVIVFIGCSDDGDVRAIDAGSDSGREDGGADSSPGDDASSLDASPDAQPWPDGGVPPETVWSLPPCAVAYGIVARSLSMGTAIVYNEVLVGFDATADRATIAAGGFDYVWQTVSERGVTMELPPSSTFSGQPVAAIVYRGNSHLLALTAWDDPATPSTDWETSLTAAGTPRTYVPINGGGVVLSPYPATAIASSGEGIDIFSAPVSTDRLSCSGVCTTRIDGNGATLAPLRVLAPGHVSDSVIVAFDEVTRRGILIEEIFDGRSKLHVTSFNDTTSGVFREIEDPFYYASRDVSPVAAAIAGDRVVIVYHVPMGTDSPTLPRYVELSLDTGEVVTPPTWYRLGEYADPLLVITPGRDGNVDMFRQPYAPYDESMPEQFANRPIEAHLDRPLPLDRAAAADVLRLGAGGWVDDLRAERVGADVWVAWHERGPCQSAPGESPPLECVGGAYWALLRCDGE